ncbi:MAG TPA: glycosyltransferase [Verrucomicrobiae bacterium]|nr:glycosyltransferase [Verrucomicrobiae bacterium]
MPGDTVRLTLALIVKNEERCLARCLESIRGAVDEIVVADTGSSDGTVSIAKQFGARIFHFAWTNDFSAARNFALDQATGDWILVLDADEYASKELASEICSFVTGRPSVGRLKIISEFKRNSQLLRSQTFVSRLFPRGARFEGRIHEQLVSSLPRKNLKGELWHDGYLETSKSDRNVKLLQEQLRSSPDNSYFLFQLALEYTSLNRPEQACDCLQKAYATSRLDEPFAPNLVVDYLYALMELKRYETGLQVLQKAEPLLADFPDFYLVRGLFYMNLIRSNPGKHGAELPQIEKSFNRCLALGETETYKSVRGSGSFLAQYNLGLLYHVFGEKEKALACFEQASALGYEPAGQMLTKLRY